MTSKLKILVVMNSSGILALDVGERRIGVAVASTIAQIASPHTTIDVKQVGDPISYIAQIVEDESVSVVVVGLPRSLDGRETSQTAYARQFAAKIESKLSVPVVMQDEAGTSVEAEARLKVRKKNYSKADIDSEAAAIILQDYLDQQVRSMA